MKHKILVLAIMFLMFNSFLFKNIIFGQVNSSESTPLKQGMARIIYTRNAGIMGAAIVHLVVDQGDSLNFNAYIVEKIHFPTEKFNFDKAGNVRLMYIKLNQKEAKLLIGKPQIGDNEASLPFDIKSFPELAAIPGPIEKFLKSGKSYFVNSDSLKPNTRIVGAVASGDTFQWDRPAGISRIEDIAPNGDQAFSPSFVIETGKTYNVNYYYMKATFEISEKK
jgi:hypothetical protein